MAALAKITVYTKANCPYCEWAKQFLHAKQLNFEEIRIDLDPEKLQEMERLSKRRTVPQIVINGQPIGGYDDMIQLSKTGELDTLLK